VSDIKSSVLITGAAGFIGFHLALRLLQAGSPVIGFDNLNSYYDRSLKLSRLIQLRACAKRYGVPFDFLEADLEDTERVDSAFGGKSPVGLGLQSAPPARVVHLAVQAGVRYSIDNPSAYIQSNLVGFGSVLEACRRHEIEHLVYASSSSVYGGNACLPFSERQGVDHPISLYAASKKANELMAHTYSHLFHLPATGLRFFTVYGPWGRPDMALFLFTRAILEGRPIQVFNQGKMVRDFTYIDDVVEALIRVLDKPATPDADFQADQLVPDPSVSWAPHRVFNVGQSRPTMLMHYIQALERALGIKAIMEMLPLQPGDLLATAADTAALEAWIGFVPQTPIDVGIDRFVTWYRDFYQI